MRGIAGHGTVTVVGPNPFILPWDGLDHTRPSIDADQRGCTAGSFQARHARVVLEYRVNPLPLPVDGSRTNGAVGEDARAL